MWTPMGGRSKEKRKVAARGRATAAKESKDSTQDRNKSKQGKQVDFGDEEQLREARAKRTDEPEVMGRLAEVRTGRGSSGLVREGDERCRADETRKGKGRVTEERVNMKAKEEELEGREHSRSRTW